METISIVGGGIAGLTTAIALDRVGVQSTVFEASSEIRPAGAGLGLAANAIMALNRLGLDNEVIKRGRILDSFSIYDQKGKAITRTDSRQLSKMYGIDNFAIHRAELHHVLQSKLKAQSIITSKKAIDVHQTEKTVTLTFADGTSHESEFLIAADGVHSHIRKKLIPGSEPRYSGYTCWRAVIDNKSHKLNEASETWGRGKRFGIVPLAGEKIYWFACLNAGQNSSKFREYNTEDLLNHFHDFHEPVPTILKEAIDDTLLWNDIVDIKPIQKYAHDNILLIGDAAHATTPNMGQGACQALEDAVVLADEIRKDSDIRQAFSAFEKRRLRRTHHIINTSWKIGKAAQLDNWILEGLRNTAFRLIPERVNTRQLEKLYQVDF